MFIDDCLKGIDLIMNSEILEPINLGSSEAVTINQLVDFAEEIAGPSVNATSSSSWFPLTASRRTTCR